VSPGTILAYLSQRPFVPFIIFTGDGGDVRVRSPEFVKLSPKGRTVVVTTGRIVDGEDEIQVIDVFLITKLTLAGPPVQFVSERESQ